MWGATYDFERLDSRGGPSSLVSLITHDAAAADAVTADLSSAAAGRAGGRGALVTVTKALPTPWHARLGLGTFEAQRGLLSVRFSAKLAPAPPGTLSPPPPPPLPPLPPPSGVAPQSHAARRQGHEKRRCAARGALGSRRMRMGGAGCASARRARRASSPTGRTSPCRSPTQATTLSGWASGSAST